jgi:large subunit ribosomal protein L35
VPKNKIKTHSSSKKRFRLTATGKVKRARANKSHILTKKSTKRKRNLRRPAIASDANTPAIKMMIPYK